MFGQTSPRANQVLALVFFLYVVLVATVAWNHEPWFDEAQAWLLARDSPLGELLTDRLRYEGTPGLWHLLLLLPAKIGLPYWTLTATSALLASATVYLFLRFAPFPWPLKLIFPFGFFTLYQYAVVARSYSLMALVLVAVAALFRKRNDHPILFFTLLALLANVNAHGFIIAGFVAAYHLGHLWLNRSGITGARLGQHLLGAFVLGVIALLVLIQVRTPQDIGFPATGVKPRNLRLLLDAFTPNHYLSLFVLGVSGVWFWRGRTFFLWALPTLGLGLLFVFKWAGAWHEGVVYYYWVFCAWVSWEAGAERTFSPQQAPPSPAFRYAQIAATVVLSFHVYWGIVCSYHDFLYPYSGSREAYAYFRQRNLQEKEIYAQGFSTVSLLPYFPQNIFDNYHDKQNPSYFLWAKGNPLLKPRRSLCRETPQFVLVGVKFEGDPGLTCPDYILLKRFEGRMFWKDTVLERDSLYLYQLQPRQVTASL